MKQKIYIGSDHRGFEIKKKIIDDLEKKFNIKDCGPFVLNEKDDYPDFAKEVSLRVAKDQKSFGILICGSGIGMSICANKHIKIRAALCLDFKMAEMTRRHNNANVLCMPASLLEKEILEIIKKFIFSDFEGGKHQKRIKKIQKYAKEF